MGVGSRFNLCKALMWRCAGQKPAKGGKSQTRRDHQAGDASDKTSAFLLELLLDWNWPERFSLTP